jgi:hypothetical protein
MIMNRQFRLAARPEGEIKASDLKLVTRQNTGKLALQLRSTRGQT